MNEKNIHEDNLILKIKESPSEGLETAIDLYGGAVKTICTNILGFDHFADVEECLSDVFVDLWKNVEGYKKEKGSLKSYVYAIARHKAIDRLRMNRKSRRDSVLDQEDMQVHINFTDEMANKINATILQEVIDELPSPDKEIFIYRYYFYEKVKTIAQRLAIPPKSIENKLYRGKEKLKAQLLERGIIL